MTQMHPAPLLKERAPWTGIEDQIPGPETMGPSLDVPDDGVYQYEVKANPSSSSPE